MSTFDGVPKIRVVLKGESPREFNSGRVIIGRSGQADYLINHDSVSRHHLEIAIVERALWIRDLNSTKGTFIEGRRVPPGKSFQIRDIQPLRLGEDIYLTVGMVVERTPVIPRGLNEIRAELPTRIPNPQPLAQAKPQPPKEEFIPPELPLEKYETTLEDSSETPTKNSVPISPLEEQEEAESEADTQIVDIFSRLKSQPPVTTVSTTREDTDGSSFSKEIELLTSDEQKLKGAIAGLNTELKDLLSKKETREWEANQRTAEVSTLNEKARQLQRQIDKLQETFDEGKRKYEWWGEEKRIEVQKAELDLNTKKREIEIQKAALQLSVQELLSKKTLAERECKVIETSVQQNLKNVEQLRDRSIELTEVNQKMEEKRERLQTEFKTLSASFQHSVDKHNELTNQIQALEAELARLRGDHEEAKVSLAELKSENANFNEKIESERQRLLSETQNALKEDADRVRKSVADEGKNAVEAMKKEAAQELEAERAVMKEQIEREREELYRIFEAEKNDQIDSMKQRKAALESQLEEKRQAVEHELGERLSVGIREVEIRREEEERSLKMQRKAQIKEVSTNIERALNTHLGPLLKQNGGEDQLFLIVEDLYDIVSSAFHSPGKMESTSNAEPNRISIDPERKKEVKKFWRHFIFGAVGVLTLTGLFMEFRTPMKRVFASFLPKSAADDQYVKKATAELAQRSLFNPPMDTEFKSTFSANALYTAHYLEIKLDSNIQKTWVVELNHFFLNELHLNEKAIVKYFAVETTLIHKLSDIRGFINASYEKEGVARMKVAEDAATPELMRVVLGEPNFDKVHAFEKSFYLRMLQQKGYGDRDIARVPGPTK
jgi:hypothetical protein